jgi:subtilisin family serine protease
MAKNEYIILRRSFSRSLDRRDLNTPTVDAHSVSATRHSIAPPEAVEVKSLDEKDADEANSDPRLLVTRSVPLSLIKPLSACDENDEKSVRAAREAGVSWGVDEVSSKASPDMGEATRIAVLDSGIDSGHPAFRGIDLIRRNFSNSPIDDDVIGHGTHCAGTIFGRDVDGVRIGVARGVRTAIIGKIMDENGRCNSGVVAKAMQWACDQGARVVSMSLGFDFNDIFASLEDGGYPREQALSMTLSYYRDTVRFFDAVTNEMQRGGVLSRGGALVLAAAGNESRRHAIIPCIVDVSLPGAADGVTSVGAVVQGANGYEIAPFSNGNATLWAPGVDIVSAKAGGGLTSMSGTSMATPHVAGVAALWSEWVAHRNPRGGVEVARSNLITSARTEGFSSSVPPEERGSGLVRAPADLGLLR